jgi:hypothetical protein
MGATMKAQWLEARHEKKQEKAKKIGKAKANVGVRKAQT